MQPDTQSPQDRMAFIEARSRFSVDDPIRITDERGHPYLTYNGFHLDAAFKAGWEAAQNLAGTLTTDTQLPHTVEQVTEAKPTAWMFELANSRFGDGTYDNWSLPRLAFTKPTVPDGSIRNLTPLYRLTTAARQLCPHCNGEGDIDDGDHPCMKCGGSGYTPVHRQPSAPSLDALREAITKLRDRYKSQMKFCDIDPLPYFRDFVRELDAALQQGASKHAE